MAVANLTKPEAWSIRELREALVAESVRIPKFQRSIIWTDEQRKTLIDSLFRGFPIGALLMHQRNDGKKTIHLLVDGLQRASTLVRYAEEPFTYVNVNDLDLKTLWEVKQAMATLIEDAVPDLVKRNEAVDQLVQRWLHQTREPKAAKGFTATRLLMLLEEQFEISGSQAAREFFDEVANSLIDELPKEISIDDVRLPVLIFKGEASELPDIFQRVNSEGTPLNKYQILAATWASTPVQIKNDAVKIAIDKKFSELLDQGYQVEGLDEPPTLFDYLAGLSQVLIDTFPLLFRAPSNPVEISGAAFLLATVAHQLRLGDMHGLPSAMEVDDDGSLNPTAFETAVVASANFVNDTLSPYIGIKLNQKGKGSSFAHTEHQIGSMITRSLVGRYDVKTWQERAGWQDDWKQLNQALPHYYLYDLIQGNWSGAGDSRMYDWTWQGTPPSPAAGYLTPPQGESWDRSLDTWFEDVQLAKNEFGRSPVRPIEKTFLRFVYADVLTHLEHEQKSFELDHVLPVKRLKDLATHDELGRPIGAVANLALFETKLNRDKGRMTVPEYLKRDDVTDEMRKMVKRYLLIEVNRTAIPQNADGADELTREEYGNFLRDRFELMKKAVMRALPS